MIYIPYVCYIVGSLCFIAGNGLEKVGPWWFIGGSLVGMGLLL